MCVRVREFTLGNQSTFPGLQAYRYWKKKKKKKKEKNNKERKSNSGCYAEADYEALTQCKGGAVSQRDNRPGIAKNRSQTEKIHRGTLTDRPTDRYGVDRLIPFFSFTASPVCIDNAAKKDGEMMLGSRPMPGPGSLPCVT